MNITSVRVNNTLVPTPYEINFNAGASTIPWEIFASDFDKWAFGDDPIVKAQFEIKGVRTVESDVGTVPSGPNPNHWRTDPNVYPAADSGILQLKSLWSASGKLRWMNPNS